MNDNKKTSREELATRLQDAANATVGRHSELLREAAQLIRESAPPEPSRVDAACPRCSSRLLVGFTECPHPWHRDPAPEQARVEARCNECGEPASTCDCGMDSEGRFDAPASTGVREATQRLRQAAHDRSDDPAMPSQQVADDVNCVLNRLQAYEKALGRLIEAAAPYIDNAAPHEQLFNAEDTRNFDRLSSAMALARVALKGEDDGRD
jgi:hypothetical protein